MRRENEERRWKAFREAFEKEEKLKAIPSVLISEYGDKLREGTITIWDIYDARHVVDEYPEKLGTAHTRSMELEELAWWIRMLPEWVYELNERLCELADMEEEWEEAEDAETVVEKAAEKLGVEIY